MGQAAAGAAVTGIYAGLKLTGFALRVATDVATTLTKEANAALSENETQREAKATLISSQIPFCIFKSEI